MIAEGWSGRVTESPNGDIAFLIIGDKTSRHQLFKGRKDE